MEKLPPQPALPERFIHRKDVQASISRITDSLDVINEELGNEHAALTASTLYSLDQAHPDTAAAIAVSIAPQVQSHRSYFHTTNVAGHYIALKASPLGESVKETTPSFRSHTQDDSIVTWATTLPVPHSQPAAVEYAFSYEHGELPSNDRMTTLWDQHHKTLGEIALELKHLRSMTDSLPHSLELLPPTTPNAFIIHWQTQTMGASIAEKAGAYASYIGEWRAIVETVLSTPGATTYNTQRGQHIVLPIPIGDTADPINVKIFGKRHVTPTVEILRAQHERIAARYRDDLHPQLSIAVDASYLPPVADAFTTPAFAHLEQTIKKAPRGEPAYTTGAIQYIKSPTKENLLV